MNLRQKKKQRNRYIFRADGIALERKVMHQYVKRTQHEFYPNKFRHATLRKVAKMRRKKNE